MILDMNRAKPPHNGIMQKVYAYDKPGGVLMGSGWVIYTDDGSMTSPDLFDSNGTKLPQGWYTLLTTDETKLIVIPRMVQ